MATSRVEMSSDLLDSLLPGSDDCSVQNKTPPSQLPLTTELAAEIANNSITDDVRDAGQCFDLVDTDKDTGELEVSVNIINGRPISAMKKDELKLELEKLGLKKSGRKQELAERLNDKLSHEINNLRHEIHGHLLSKSPSVEKSELAKLQDENNALKQRLSDIENRYDSLKREAETMYDENKSLMTALRLVNSENVKENKNLDIKSSKNKGHDLHDVESSWVIVGQ